MSERPWTLIFNLIIPRFRKSKQIFYVPSKTTSNIHRLCSHTINWTPIATMKIISTITRNMQIVVDLYSRLSLFPEPASMMTLDICRLLLHRLDFIWPGVSMTLTATISANPAQTTLDCSEIAHLHLSFSRRRDHINISTT